MNEQPQKWTKSNIPEYTSERVKIEYIHDYSDKRHLHHKQVIRIDDVIVNIVTVSEDDDWSCYNQSEDMPSQGKQWSNWVASLED